MESFQRIAVTMGDPAGVGPEIIVKSFSQYPLSSSSQAVIIGDAKILEKAARLWAPDLTVKSVSSFPEFPAEKNQLRVIDLKNVPLEIKPGIASGEGGSASVEYIKKAVQMALSEEVDIIVTAPISKESIHKAGHHYPGHTELLGELTGASKTILMLAGKELRVALVTTHASIMDVPALITQDAVYDTLVCVNDWLVRHVSASPRIAVVGLNPHCGDGGVFGKEESETIVPAIQKAQKEGIQAEGPFSADALFSRGVKHDAVIAMYHDQGMIPVKMESQGHAINITLGLPILRISVDHGTAFDIAWKGVADPTSMTHVLESAAQFSRNTCAEKG